MAIRKPLALAFAVFALIAMLAGCNSEDAVAPFGQDEAPVVAPTNVRAEIVNGSDILISWNPSTQPSVRGYNVYRFDYGNSAVARLNKSVVTGSSYTDGAAAFSETYEYRVTSVAANDNESSYAAVVITNHTPAPDRGGRTPVISD